jgi:hypothetical protein
MGVFLAETAKPGAAGTIARAAGPGAGDSFAAVGAASGTLCAMLIARSFVKGIPSVETQASLDTARHWWTPWPVWAATSAAPHKFLTGSW